MIPAPSSAAPANNHGRMHRHNRMQPPPMRPPRGNVNPLPCQVRPSEYPRPPIPGENNARPDTRVKRLKKANINIATLNINGATSRDVRLLSKWSEISSTLYEYKIAILTIQETHMNQQITDQVRECFSRNLDIIASEDPTSPTSKAGVAFVINKALIKPLKVTTHKLVPGRALLLKIKWLEGCETSILNIYALVNRAAQPQF
jgi:hypothetical protein